MELSSSPMAESPGSSSRYSSPNPSPTRTETDLPNDVDESFNSSMSLSDSFSPSRGPSTASVPALVFGAPKPSFVPKRPDPVPIQRSGAGPSKRTFGRELSLNTRGTGMMLPPAVPDKARQAKRGGIPMQWTGSDELFREPPSPRSTMDVDSPAPGRSPASYGSPGLGSFFCESPMAPQMGPGKRRSVVEDSPSLSNGSPSAKRSSARMDKTVSSGMLFGSTSTRHTLAVRRGPPTIKRPLLAPVSTASSRTPSFASADAVLYGPKTLGANLGTFPRSSAAPMRRAFSVCDQGMPEQSEDESEYDNSPSAAALRGRRAAPDGSPFKAVRSSIAVPRASPKGKQPSMPGFGEDEMDGKVLPCHLVKEDGLVRITPETLGDLIGGKYADKMARYHVVDCRFDYEYAGGHIAGAINVKTADALDGLLLTQGQGLHESAQLPSPSRSGEAGEKVVLVFHCEFSAKRAPTFAKHLRRCDRTLNIGVYPRICFPEVYILEGGYCGFYQSQRNHCSPQGYTRMDDPQHVRSRDSELHNFRNFSRTKSFTYGETQGTSAALAAGNVAQGRRHGGTIAEEGESPAATTGAGGLWAGAGAGSGSGTDESGTEASPCPRVVSMGAPPLLGSVKTRTLGRAGAFMRTASYAGAGGMGMGVGVGGMGMSGARALPRAPF